MSDISLVPRYVGILSGLIQNIGYLRKETERDLEFRKVQSERIDIILQGHIHEEQERVNPVYNAKGELIQYDKYGRHLDVVV